MHRRLLSLSILVVLFPLSGCVAGSGTTGTSSAPPASISVAPGGGTADSVASGSTTSGDGTGHLEGVVLDTELFPIAGVSVQVASTTDLASAVKLQTNDGGVFRVDGIAPGDYLVQAAKEGYGTVDPSRVHVVDEDVTRVRILLERIVIHNATIDTYRVDSYFGLSSCFAVPSASVCPPLCFIVCPDPSVNTSFQHKVNESITGRLVGLVAEGIYTPTYQQCDPGFRTGVSSPSTGQQGFYWSTPDDRVHSPSHLYVPRDGDDETNAIDSPAHIDANGGKPIDPNGQWYFGSYPAFFAQPDYAAPGVYFGCTYSQHVTFYYSLMYGTLPTDPGNWTAIPH